MNCATFTIHPLDSLCLTVDPTDNMKQALQGQPTVDVGRQRQNVRFVLPSGSVSLSHDAHVYKKDH